MDEPMALIWGNPASGFKIVAPVNPNDPELDEFIDRKLHNETWWYLPLQSLRDVRAEGGLP